MPSTHACHREVQALGEYISELGSRGHADEQHLACLNNLVGEVLPDVDVLGSLPPADDVVTLLDDHCVVFVDLRGRRLGEPARGACGGTEPRFPPSKPDSTLPLPWTEQ